MVIGSVTAVEKHVDQLETIFNAFVIGTLIVLIAGADASNTVDVFGLKLTSSGGYGVVAAAFASVFFVLTHGCWKISDLLANSPPEDIDKALAAVLTHRWLLNPFSYYGSGFLSIVNCAVGIGLLMFFWWVGAASLGLLASVAPAAPDTADKILFTLYWFLGATSLFGIGRVYRVMLIVRRVEGNSWLGGSLPRFVFIKCAVGAIACVFGWYTYYDFKLIGM